MGQQWDDERARLSEALELVERARELIDGYVPTAEGHLGSASVVLRSMLSTAHLHHSRSSSRGGQTQL